MKTFKNWNSYSEFANEVRYENRYIYSPKAIDFLDTLLETSKSLKKTIPKDEIFWRAQRGGKTENGSSKIIEPYPVERMYPQKDTAYEGRANPKGIPYLYLATTKETAMAETKPWKGSIISVSDFSIKEDLELIDFTTYETHPLCSLNEHTDENILRNVWGEINRAFSTPINPSDDSADYVSTQIISELFKNKGFDGIEYKSSLEKGHNIMLFDKEKAILKDRLLYNLKDITFRFEKNGDAIIE